MPCDCCDLPEVDACSIDFEPKWNRNWDEVNPEDLYATSLFLIVTIK